MQAAIDAQVESDPQAQTVIRELEESHDATLGEVGTLQPEELPTSEELGAAFQRFLAERARRPGGEDS